MCLRWEHPKRRKYHGSMFEHRGRDGHTTHGRALLSPQVHVVGQPERPVVEHARSIRRRRTFRAREAAKSPRLPSFRHHTAHSVQPQSEYQTMHSMRKLHRIISAIINNNKTKCEHRRRNNNNNFGYEDQLHLYARFVE
jgi:hypothetical protein